MDNTEALSAALMKKQHIVSLSLQRFFTNQWFCICLCVWLVSLSTADSYDCSNGLFLSVWKAHESKELKSWIENNVLETFRNEAKQRNETNTIFANAIQPIETNVYMNHADHMLQNGLLDVFDVDIVYAGRFKDPSKTSNLLTIPELKSMYEYLDKDLTKAYSTGDGKKMVAFPWRRDQGILIYRKDLLKKHKYDPQEPLSDTFTWERMGEIVKKIKKNEQNIEEGYAFQGKNYEGLTCNIMEWMGSDGLSSRIIDGDKVTLDESNIKLVSESFERVGGWIKDEVSSPNVLSYNELSVMKKFNEGKVLFARLWNGNYDTVQNYAKAKGWDIGVSYLPKGKTNKAATIGGWGVSIGAFSEEKGNTCRKTNAVKALQLLVNQSTQRYFYNKFQRYPTFNSKYMKAMCNEHNNSQHIACLLTKIQSKDVTENKIRKLVGRPDVSVNYHLKSQIIYEFVHIFLELKQKKYENILEKQTQNHLYSPMSKISNATFMLQSLRCMLEKELQNDNTMGKAHVCKCGKSEVSCSSTKELTKSDRTENNKFLFLDEQSCEHNFHYISNITVALGWFFVVLVYLISIALAKWILTNLKHVVINHSQPVFLIIVLLGVCCNVSTIIPLLMDESKINGCMKLRGKSLKQHNDTNDNAAAATSDFQMYESECQNQLDAACKAIPFLYFYGFIITFSALLTKLWRVEKIFNNKKLRRIKINTMHLLLLIAFFLMIVTVINLFLISSSEAFLDGQGFTWWRMKINQKSLIDPVCSLLPKLGDGNRESFCEKYYTQIYSSSVGACRFSQTSCSTLKTEPELAIVLHLILMLLFLLYSLYIAIKTRKIKTSYNEGKFILISLVNQTQLIFVFIAVVNSVNATVYVAAVSCIIGFSNLSTLTFIFVPKLIVYYAPHRAKSYNLKRVASHSVDRDSRLSATTTDVELTVKGVKIAT